MKVSYRKIVLWALAAIVILFVLVQPSFQRGKYVYDIQTISNVCSFDEFPQQNVATSGGDTIIITMPIQTPTPCYTVKGTVNLFGSDMSVNLQTEKNSDTCAQCVGTVVAKVTISNLDKGTYSVQINTPDKQLIVPVKVG